MAAFAPFERLDGSVVMQRLLRWSVVVQTGEAVQRLPQILGAVEVVRVEHLRDVSVKTPNDAMSL